MFRITLIGGLSGIFLMHAAYAQTPQSKLGLAGDKAERKLNGTEQVEKAQVQYNLFKSNLLLFTEACREGELENAFIHFDALKENAESLMAEMEDRYESKGVIHGSGTSSAEPEKREINGRLSMLRDLHRSIEHIESGERDELCESSEEWEGVRKLFWEELDDLSERSGVPIRISE